MEEMQQCRKLSRLLVAFFGQNIMVIVEGINRKRYFVSKFMLAAIFCVLGMSIAIHCLSSFKAKNDFKLLLANHKQLPNSLPL
jgi:hypothetical protein